MWIRLIYVIWVVTAPAGICDASNRPIVHGMTSRTMNISWSHDYNNITILNYIIYTRIGKDGLWNATKEIITPYNETNYNVENLKPHTMYAFRVAAVTSFGPSHPSEASKAIYTKTELPEGKPIITAAHNTSATSLYLAWKPPSRDTIHGDFIGYRIRYRRREKADEEMKNVYIDSAVENYTIRNLHTFMEYLVSLDIQTQHGYGPASNITVMTDEDAPTKPENLTSRGITGTTIELSWSEPDNANGIIAGYRIYYMHSNYTDVKMHIPEKSMNSDDSYIEFVLKELHPCTDYEIWVKAYTKKNEGEPSDKIFRRTDITGPSAPQILNLTCPSDESVYVHWARPANFSGSIDYYYITYRRESGIYDEEIELSAVKNHLESGAIIPNLTVNTVYEISVRGATRSIINTSEFIEGHSSFPKKVRVTRNCDKIQPLTTRSNNDLSEFQIILIIYACLSVVVIAIFGIVACVMYFCEKKCVAESKSP